MNEREFNFILQEGEGQFIEFKEKPDNRLAITNLGGLMKPLTLENFGKIAVRRNPLIADLFHRIHFIEKMGTGIRRIKESCLKHGSVKFSYEADGYFIAEFRLIKNGTLKGTLKELLEFIKNNPGIQANEISERLDRPLDTIKKQIKKLIDRNAIERRGSRKTGGYWKIRKNL